MWTLSRESGLHVDRTGEFFLILRRIFIDVFFFSATVKTDAEIWDSGKPGPMGLPVERDLHFEPKADVLVQMNAKTRRHWISSI